jgi:hypothetical protein
MEDNVFDNQADGSHLQVSIDQLEVKVLQMLHENLSPLKQEQKERFDQLEARILKIPHENLTESEQARISREGIRHEDELISKRLTWMTTIHGFLFSALGFSFGKSLSIVFFVIIGGMGVLISFSTLLVLRSAIRATNTYIAKWQDVKDSSNPRNQIVTYKSAEPDSKICEKIKLHLCGANPSPNPNGTIIGHVEDKGLKGCLKNFVSPPMFLPIIFGSGWSCIIIFASCGNLDPTIQGSFNIENNSLKLNIKTPLVSKPTTVKIQEPTTVKVQAEFNRVGDVPKASSKGVNPKVD